MRLTCAECGAVSDERAEGWRAYLAGDFDEVDEVLSFCASCAEREFGSRLERPRGDAPERG